MPIRIDWPVEFYLEQEVYVSLLFGSVHVSVPLHSCEIELTDIIKFKVYSEGHTSEFSLKIEQKTDEKGEIYGDYNFTHISGEKIEIISKGRSIALEEFFNENPPAIWFEDGSCVTGNIFIALNNEIVPFTNDKILVWDWTGTKIRKESQGIDKDPDSIQFKVIQKLKTDGMEVIMNDDGAGEIADVVAFKTINKDGKDRISIELYHCKFSSEDNPGARLKDLYEVCGQTQRSSHWKEKPIEIFAKVLRRGNLKESGKSISRFEVGDAKILDKLKRIANNNDVEMNIILCNQVFQNLT